MNADWQTWAAPAVVAVTAAGFVWRFVRNRRRAKSGKGCGHGCGCGVPSVRGKAPKLGLGKGR